MFNCHVSPISRFHISSSWYIGMAQSDFTTWHGTTLWLSGIQVTFTTSGETAATVWGPPAKRFRGYVESIGHFDTQSQLLPSMTR